jgi:DNA repair protein RadC
MRGKLEHLEVEQFHVIGLNTKNAVVFEEMVSQGSINASIVTPRETFHMLIRRHCAGAIVAHNHPSGDHPTPSKEDVALTEVLVESGKILGIPVLDHVIVGQGKYYSFKEHLLL